MTEKTPTTATSKDIHGKGFREVEFVDDDSKDTFGKYSSPHYNPEKTREYKQRIKGTDVYERVKERSRLYLAKERACGYNRGDEWNKENRLRWNEYLRKYRKESGLNKRQHQKYGKLRYTMGKKSGYDRIAKYLIHRKIKPPLNFTSAYTNRPWLKKGQWAWTFAHP